MKPDWVQFNSTVQWSHLQMELDLKLNLFHSTAEIGKKTGKKYLWPIHFSSFTIIFHNLRNFRLPVGWTSALGAYEVKKAALSAFFMEIVKVFFKETSF